MADDSNLATEAIVAPYSTPAQRAEFGRQARERLPRSAFADWKPADNRPDSTTLLLDQGATRIAGLVPLRHTRMALSAFAFYRGSAIVMANDLGPTLNSGLWAQVCGDAHLANFGIFGSSERNLVFDLNDFDETTRGPFEWDVLRLAASFILATTANGGNLELAKQAATAVGASYQAKIGRAAQRGLLANWYDKFTPSDVAKFASQNVNKKAAKGSKQFVKQGVKPPSSGTLGQRFANSPRSGRMEIASSNISRRCWSGSKASASSCWSTCSPHSSRPCESKPRACSRVIAFWIWRTRSSVLAASACAPGRSCCRARTKMICWSCSSKKPSVRCWKTSWGRQGSIATASASWSVSA